VYQTTRQKIIAAIQESVQPATMKEVKEVISIEFGAVAGFLAGSKSKNAKSILAKFTPTARHFDVNSNAGDNDTCLCPYNTDSGGMLLNTYRLHEHISWTRDLRNSEVAGSPITIILADDIKEYKAHLPVRSLYLMQSSSG